MTNHWLLPSLLTLGAGALLGYAAASADLPPVMHAAVTKAAAAPHVAEPAEAKPAPAGCCPNDLSRSDQLALANHNQLVAATLAQTGKQPNICIIWGDDIGQSNVSAYSMGLMGYKTPNIDRIAKEGMLFTDYYGEQSCTAGRRSSLVSTGCERA